MKQFKQPLLFSLAMLPIAVAAAVFTCLYQFDLYPAEILEQAVAQLGSTTLLLVIAVIQTVIYTLICAFFGHILAEKLGLWRDLTVDRGKVCRTLLISVVLGIVFSLDYWIFGHAVPAIREATAAGMTVNGILASILYGGIIEEIMLRLFFLSLIAFLLWKLFFRKADREHIPPAVFLAANILAALMFAAGHLPATITTFGTLTPLIVFRCFLLNGGFGFAFGQIYRKYGILYAILSHAAVHIVSKLIWLIFL